MAAGGIKSLRKIQLARETTSGTAISTATVLWRGQGTIEDNTVVTFPEEDIGYISGVDRAYIPQVGATLELTQTPLNIFQVPYLFEMGVKAVNTGAADGSGSDKVYTYPISTNAKNATAAYTIQGGDDTDVERMEYAFAETISLTGQANQAWMMGGTLRGRQVTDVTSFNPTALALQTGIDDLLFNKSKLYLDAVGGTLGATQYTLGFLQATINLRTGWFARATGDGQLYFSYIQMAKPQLDFNLRVVHDSQGVARKTDWRALTARQMRIDMLGAALTTAGTTYATNTLRFNVAAKGLKVSKVGELNGEDVLDVSYNSRYNSTAGLYAAFICAIDGLTTLA